MEAESVSIGGMLSQLTELEAPPIEFDEKLWHAVVDRVTVYNDDRLVYSLKALQKRYTALTRQRAEKEYKADILSGFLFEIGEYDVLDTEWSDSRFHAIVDHITVHNDGRFVFTFRNGSEEMVMM